jgi:hypothetical protein
MKRSMFALAAAAALSLSVASVQAADVTPGWYNGTGNPNGGFTVTTSNGVELGLRAKYRHNPAVITPTGDTYTVVAGPETNTTNGGNGTPSGTPRAAWNYEFSINVGSANLLKNYTTTLTITDPGGNTTTPPINPLSYWADDTDQAGGSLDTAADYVAQNSENPAFGDFPLAGSYSLWTTGQYTFTLNVFDPSGGSPIATDTIHVDVVPVPLPKAAYAGLGLIAGLGVLGGLKRRQRKLA